MSAHLRFIAVPTADTPGTLLALNFDDKRYLFGQVAEGSQRISLQRGMNFVKTKALFLSGTVGWQNTGGLTGLALTLADTLNTHAAAVAAAGKEDTLAQGEEQGMTVYGGHGLLHSVASGRKYIFRTGGYIRFREFEMLPEDKPDFEDKNIRVWTIRVNSSQAPVQSSLPAHERIAAKQRVKQIAKDMWESTWRRDNLEEMELQRVKLPIKALWVRDPETKDLSPYSGPLPDGQTPLANPTMKVLVRKPWPGAVAGDLYAHEPDGVALSYLIRTYPRRGRFSKEKAKGLKVTEGPNYARLTSGQSVKNEEGEIITPDMVLDPERPGQGILILDVPTPSHVDHLLHQLQNLGDGKAIQDIQVAIWLLPPGMAQDQSLVAFMDQTKHIKHIIASSDLCPNIIALSSTEKLISLLRSVLPSFIAPPLSDSTAVDSIDGFGSNKQDAASTTLEIGLRPDFKVQQMVPEPKAELEIPALIPDLVATAQSHNQQSTETFQNWRETLARPDAEVIFLGTGSAIPALTRNVTGILLRVPGHGNYILDCGESTVGQLRRMFPVDEYNQILRDLRMIWISHMHADHHLGTIGLLKSWYHVVHGQTALAKPVSTAELRELLLDDGSARQRLPIVANRNFHEMIADFAQIEDIGYSRVLPIEHTPASIDMLDRRIENPTKLDVVTSLLAGRTVDNLRLDQTLHASIFGALGIETTYVKHCKGASGVALTFDPSSLSANEATSESATKLFRVAWSGDCRPSRSLTVIGEDADVLIHECTFGTGFEGQAKAKAHSTMREAIRVAEAMSAKSLLLTHFSQRYSRLPDMAGLSAPLEGRDVARERLLQNELDEVSFAVEEVDVGEAEAEGADLLLDANAAVINGNSDADAQTSPATNTDATMTGTDAGPAPTTDLSSSSSFIPSPLPISPAFDFMRIRIGDIPLMQAYTPALIELFREPEKPPVAEGAEAQQVHISAATGTNGHDDAKAAPKKKKQKQKRSDASSTATATANATDANAATTKQNKTQAKKRRKTLETPSQTLASAAADAAAAAAVVVTSAPEQAEVDIADGQATTNVIGEPQQ